MPNVRRAVIDVGTNSVKLLVADVAGHEVRPVREAGNQTRLGQGFYKSHRLQPAAIRRTAAAVAEYAEAARQLGAVSVRVFATSAARDATNAQDLIAGVAETSGLGLEIITGAREAEWAFQGVRTHRGFARVPLLLLEVGGGSTQFILGESDQIHLRESFPLGAVRLMERVPHSDPPTRNELEACRAWLQHALLEWVEPRLRPALRQQVALHAWRHPVQLVGVGGTATVLARMQRGLEDFDRDQIEAVRLTRARLRVWVERLWSLPLAERQTLVGLPPERADVMLTGVLVFESVLARFGFETLRVSTRGLRFAAVREGASEDKLATQPAV